MPAYVYSDDLRLEVRVVRERIIEAFIDGQWIEVYRAPRGVRIARDAPIVVRLCDERSGLWRPRGQV